MPAVKDTSLIDMNGSPFSKVFFWQFLPGSFFPVRRFAAIERSYESLPPFDLDCSRYKKNIGTPGLKL